MKELFGNSILLTRFMLRRERVIGSVWILMIFLFSAGFVPVIYEAMDEGGRGEVLAMLENPAMIAMMGPAYALISPTFGAFYSNLMLLWVGLMVCVMNIFVVVRHTRADEESGRYEVIRSLPTGRLANINAAMITAVIINVIMAIVVGLGMFAAGDYSMELMPSMLWAMALGVLGIVFAGITALICQLSTITRSVTSYSIGTLVALFVLRAPGDINSNLEWLSRANPAGLFLRTQAYINNYVWPVFVLLAMAFVFWTVAYQLNVKRDIDQGMIPARPGRAHGSRLLSSTQGLSWRLLRVPVVVMIVTMYAFGAAYGVVLDEIEHVVATNEMYQTMILAPTGIDTAILEGLDAEQSLALLNEILGAAGFSIAQLFASFMNGMIAVLAAIAVITFVSRIKSEEQSMRAELILVTPVSRFSFMFGFVIIAFVSTALMQVMFSLGLYQAASAVLINPDVLPLRFVMEAAILYVPAQWVMIGIALLLIGLKPKFSAIVWVYLMYCFVLELIGRIGIFPDWIMNTTPFGFIPQLPFDEINYVVISVLIAVSFALSAAGYILYSRRDINAIRA